MEKNKKIAFFERGSWYDRTKSYDENFMVKYGKKGGFKTAEEAEASYYKYLSAFETQKKELQKRKDSSIYLKEYLQVWLNQQKDFASSTVQVYQYVLDCVIPMMPDIKVCAVTENYINTLIRKISEQKLSYGLKLYELFGMALSSAFSDGILDFDPMKNVQRPRREKHMIFLYSDTEKTTFLQYAKRCDWYLEILLGMFCVLKRGEIYGLKFGDFDIEKKQVKIQREIVAKKTEGKNGKMTNKPVEKDIRGSSSERTLTLHDTIIKEVLVRKKQSENAKFLRRQDYRDHDLITCQKNGEYRALASFNKFLKGLCRQAGVPEVSPQDLRDMYAEMMLRTNRVSFLVLKGLMGYATIEDVYERYSELTELEFSHNQYINKEFPAG